MRHNTRRAAGKLVQVAWRFPPTFPKSQQRTEIRM